MSSTELQSETSQKFFVQEGASNVTQFHSGPAFKVSLSENLAIVSFDLEGERVNKWDESSLRELDRILAKLESHKGLLSAVLFRSAKPKSFIVGADIKVIEGLTTFDRAALASDLGQKIFSRLEDLPIVTIAAVEGPCMGGGTEFALSCDYRVASDSEKTLIGLPETKLGVIPGWGGNYRMTRYVELPQALDLILSGKALNAAEAYRCGLVDEVYPESLFPTKVIEFALTRKSKRKEKTPKYSNLANRILCSTPMGRTIVFKKAREALVKQTRGHYPAPVRALEVIEKCWSKPRAEWMKLEQEYFSDLAIGDISKNLIRIFFMTENVKKDSGTALSPEELKKLRPIGQVGVLGAGVMGAGIAYQSALKGLRVFMKDVSYLAVGKGLEHAKNLLTKSVERRKLTRLQSSDALARIRPQIDYSGFKGLDLVVEAIVENLEVKKKVFGELEAVVRNDCMLATNTSSLRLADIAQGLKLNDRFIGLHFFNPVDKMPLVEVVVTDATPAEQIARAVSFVKQIGKTPLVCKDGPGFLVNRLLVPFLIEAGYFLEEGADLECVEKEIKNFGMPMGPYELLDEIGLDVVTKISPIFEQSLGERFKSAPSIYKIAEDKKAKRYGKKSGLGFYRYEGSRRGLLDRAGIEALIGKKLSGENFQLRGEALAQRMIFPMINEAAVALEEKIVLSPEKVDLGMVFGVGFPPFRGGLCRYAEKVGLQKVAQELSNLSEKYGPRFAPTPALRRAAERGHFSS